MEVFRAISSALRTGFNIMEKQLSLGPTEKCNIVVIFLEHITGMSIGWGKTLFIDMFGVELKVLHYFEAFRDSAIDDQRQKIPGSQNTSDDLVKFVVENIEKPIRVG